VKVLTRTVSGRGMHLDGVASRVTCYKLTFASVINKMLISDTTI